MPDHTAPIAKNIKASHADFHKGILREGTVLKYKGFVITHKGRQVDIALLSESNIRDRFQLEQLRKEKEREKLLGIQPPLRPDVAFKKINEKTYVNVAFKK